MKKLLLDVLRRWLDGPRGYWIVLVLAAVTCGAAAAGAAVRGLYAESYTSVDGVTVRRIRDTEEGVVCYVASGFLLSDQATSYSFRGRMPSISCVRTKGKDSP